MGPVESDRRAHGDSAQPVKGPGARLTNGLQCQRNDGVGRAAPHQFSRPRGAPTGTWRLIRIKEVGLVRKSTKSKAGERTLRLPAFALSMLRRPKLKAGGRGPAFPDSEGGWRDPSNTSRDLRNARGSEEFAWVTSHVFRKPAATDMDRAGLTARQIADQLGHAKVSMTQENYLGRRLTSRRTAQTLDQAIGRTPG